MKIFNLLILVLLFCNNIITSDNELEIIQQTEWYQTIAEFSVPIEPIKARINASLDDLFTMEQNQNNTKNNKGRKKTKKGSPNKSTNISIDAIKDFVRLETENLLNSWNEVINQTQERIVKIDTVTDFLYTNTDEDKDFILSGTQKTDQRIKEIIDDLTKLFTKESPSSGATKKYRCCREFLANIDKKKRKKFINSFEEICENHFVPFHKAIESKNNYFNQNQTILFINEKIKKTQKKITLGITMLKRHLKINDQTFNEQLEAIKAFKTPKNPKYNDATEFENEIQQIGQENFEHKMKTRIFARIMLYLKETEIDDLTNYNTKAIDYICYAEELFSTFGTTMLFLYKKTKQVFDMMEHTLVVNAIRQAYILHALIKKFITQSKIDKIVIEDTETNQSIHIENQSNSTEPNNSQKPDTDNNIKIDIDEQVENSRIKSEIVQEVTTKNNSQTYIEDRDELDHNKTISQSDASSQPIQQNNSVKIEAGTSNINPGNKTKEDKIFLEKIVDKKEKNSNSNTTQEQKKIIDPVYQTKKIPIDSPIIEENNTPDNQDDIITPQTLDNNSVKIEIIQHINDINLKTNNDIINQIDFNAKNNIIIPNITDFYVINNESSQPTQQTNNQLTTTMTKKLENLGLKKQEENNDNTTKKDKNNDAQSTIIQNVYNTSRQLYHIPSVSLVVLFLYYASTNSQTIQAYATPLINFITQQFARIAS